MIDDEIREVAERIANKLFEDVVEVVRCKDCKHSVPDIVGDKIEGYECDLCYDSYWGADDFCSRGERE